MAFAAVATWIVVKRPRVAWDAWRQTTRREPLLDGHGRLIGDLRVSVTDRCNFRCQYCMPAEGLPWLERDEVLRFEEIARLVALLAAMGVGDVRLTGGEPLVRRDFPRWSRCWPPSTASTTSRVTTNGYLLERDAEALVRAGVRRASTSRSTRCSATASSR